MGFEVALVLHGRDVVDPVTEIEMVDLLLAAVVDKGQDVEGAQTAAIELRVKEEVDRVQPAAAAVDDGDADKSVSEMVADFVCLGDIVEKKTEVVLFGAVAPVREAVLQKRVTEGQALRARLQGGDLPGQILVALQGSLLIAVEADIVRVKANGHTTLASLTDHGIEAVAAAPVAVGHQPFHDLLRDPVHQGLPVGCRVGQFVGTVQRDVEEIFLQVRLDQVELHGGSSHRLAGVVMVGPGSERKDLSRSNSMPLSSVSIYPVMILPAAFNINCCR